jgi:endonuclease G
MKLRYLLPVLCTVILFSCKKQIEQTPLPSSSIAGEMVDMLLMTTTLTEDFETGSKGSYAAANVTLASGSWYFDDALLGSLANDRKNGSKSARIQNTGSIAMNFNVSGTATISIKHAVYGTDGSSTWQLQLSTDSSTYTAFGDVVTSNSTSLQSVSYTLKTAANIRFKIKKLSGGSNRINIDDVVITPFEEGTDNDHILIGNPTNALHVVDSTTNYFMDKGYYALSYHKDRATPNWVSWHLNQGDLDTTDRTNTFRQDSSLPVGWYRAGSTSYQSSGFDRGHNCPSADRTLTYTANSSTFLMTNMIPQAPYLNQQTWGNMEDYIRAQVNTGKEAYIIMGSYGIGGTGSNGYATTIKNGLITVPNRMYKVVVLLGNGNNDLSRIDTATRIIAVDVQNDNSVSSNWKLYRTSVNAIEANVGYDLFKNVSVLVKGYLKAKVDNL